MIDKEKLEKYNLCYHRQSDKYTQVLFPTKKEYREGYQMCYIDGKLYDSILTNPLPHDYPFKLMDELSEKYLNGRIKRKSFKGCRWRIQKKPRPPKQLSMFD